MHKYSNFFQTLYDQTFSIGALGRGTHYSILRTIIWHDSLGNSLKKAAHHDFAIIWDEDHDIRIIKVIEEIYYNGLLQHFHIFGERKGMFTALMTENNYNVLTDNSIKTLYKTISKITDENDDPWNLDIAKIYDINNHYIISDSKNKIILYLSHIMMLWNLGFEFDKIFLLQQ